MFFLSQSLHHSAKTSFILTSTTSPPIACYFYSHHVYLVKFPTYYNILTLNCLNEFSFFLLLLLLLLLFFFFYLKNKVYFSSFILPTNTKKPSFPCAILFLCLLTSPLRIEKKLVHNELFSC